MIELIEASVSYMWVGVFCFALGYFYSVWDNRQKFFNSAKYREMSRSAYQQQLDFMNRHKGKELLGGMR